MAESSTQLKWYPVGNGNPFDAPILDVRSFALNQTSTTSNPVIAENYSRSRKSDGREFISREPDNPTKFIINLTYPHNGAELNGVVFKSPQMEVKWDIYAYGDWFYFTRSWTSDLLYKVRYENTGSSLVLKEVIGKDICNNEDAQDIHCLMLTHAMNQVWPFHIPDHIQEQDLQTVLLHMFSRFGSRATLLTKANTLLLKRTPKS